jgi:hypothetical protein
VGFASLNPPYELARLLAVAGGKVSFDAFNADGDRTGPIKNRNVIGYSAD